MSVNDVLAFKRSTVAFKAPAFVAARSFSAAGAPSGESSDVVIPELVETLEWVLDSPPNVHQFDEPPVWFNFLLISFVF